MKGDKNGLLDKKKGNKNKYVEVQEEWIELEDMRPKENEKPVYSKLNDEPVKYPDLNQNASKNQPKNQVLPPTKQNYPSVAPNIIPSQSMMSHPKVITMNGSTFKEVSPQQEKIIKKSKIPMMEVGCQFCTMLQKVPGNTQVYICMSCNNMNQCYPLYGIFICGCCQCQVCYGFGTSEFIKCTRCGTINKVPTEPVKKYKKQTEKPIIKEKEKEKEERFLDDQILLSQFDDQKSDYKPEFSEKDYKFDD